MSGIQEKFKEIKQKASDTINLLRLKTHEQELESTAPIKRSVSERQYSSRQYVSPGTEFPFNQPIIAPYSIPGY